MRLTKDNGDTAVVMLDEESHSDSFVSINFRPLGPLSVLFHVEDCKRNYNLWYNRMHNVNTHISVDTQPEILEKK